MSYEEAQYLLAEGEKMRLPEWRGYWFMDSQAYKALTKDGEIKPAWKDDEGIKARTDWEIALGLDFGWAICALKAGKLITRKGWNGKGMFLFIRPSDELTTGFIPKVKSLPQAVKDYIDQHVDDKKNPSEEGLTPVKFTAYICMKAADGTIVNGWLASQTDMLAEDWQLFES